jgi:hypothetical protein
MTYLLAYFDFSFQKFYGFQARAPASAAKPHALIWCAFQPGHHVLCQMWSLANTDLGCLIANCRIGQSAHRCTFSTKNALFGIVASLGSKLSVFSIINNLLLIKY